MTGAEPVDIVVGAASGMGAAVARQFGGRPLLLADVDDTGLRGVAEDLGGKVHTLHCDVTDSVDLDRLVRSAGELGPLGAVVVTAGLSPSMAGGRRIHEVNLRGPERTVRALEPHVGERTVGVILASMAGHMVPADPVVDEILDDPLAASYFDRLAALGLDPEDSAFAYALSKRGVIRLVQRHADRWGRRGARLVSVSPGIVATPMGALEDARQPEMEGMVERSALGRRARADEVAAVVKFLASDEASFLTGTDVLVDGGAVAGGLHPGAD